MGTLYLVSTPIGNLEDITLRALRVLGEVALIAAEDTRHSGRLLKHFDIDRPLISLHEHNEQSRIPSILASLAQGDDVALISDAGTPTLSDPGYRLVCAAIESGHAVIPVPGASAILTALVASGLPPDRFLFLGFPPRKTGARREFLGQVAAERGTLIFFESPRRLRALLADIVEVLGAERDLVVARELTKRYETFWRGKAAAAPAAFPEPPPGEVVVLVAGAGEAREPEIDENVRVALAGLLAGGMSTGDAARLLFELTGLSRRDLYQLALALQK